MRRKLTVAAIVAASLAAAAAAAFLLPRSTLPGTTVADVPVSAPPQSKGVRVDAAPFASPHARRRARTTRVHVAAAGRHRRATAPPKPAPAHTTTAPHTTTTTPPPTSAPHASTQPDHSSTTTAGPTNAPPKATHTTAKSPKPKPTPTPTPAKKPTRPPPTTTTTAPPPTTTTTAPPPTTTTTTRPTTTTTAPPPPPPPPPKPPTLRLPDAMTVDATTPGGTAVSFAASATDSSGGNLQVSCAPASGATFPIATTTVHCKATDAHGVSADGTFTVHVNGANEEITNLDGVLDGMNLDSDLTKTLQSSLDKAAKADKPKDTCDAINDFPIKVVDEAGNPKPRLTIPQAQTLTHGAMTIESVLACVAANSPADDATGKLLGLLQTIDGLGLADGEHNDLSGKVSNIAKQVLGANASNACKKLDDFANQLNDDSSGKKPKLTTAQAGQLSAALPPIRSSLGC